MQRSIGGRRLPAAVALLLALALLTGPQSHRALSDVGAVKPLVPTELPAPLVYLRDIDPSILQDIRYAGTENFTGRHVPGYAAAECVLLREAAEALSRVQKALLERNLTLKVYDCYRPHRAVRAFVKWVGERTAGSDPRLKRFHPNVARRHLIRLGYIAAQSRHSRGDTVDLTLVQLPAKPAAPVRHDAAYGPCTAPAGKRAPETGVDMGTAFDCFDPLSHTDAPGIDPAQRRWRRTLVAAMAKEGFRNYRKEWWHFTLAGARAGRSFDVPIQPRQP